MTDFEKQLEFWLNVAYAAGWTAGVEGSPRREHHTFELKGIKSLINNAPPMQDEPEYTDEDDTGWINPSLNQLRHELKRYFGIEEANE